MSLDDEYLGQMSIDEPTDEQIDALLNGGAVDEMNI